MALKVIKERCTGCGLCVQVCPYNAIKLSDENVAEILESCILCGQCIEACPMKALLMEEKHGEEATGYRGVMVFVEHEFGRINHVSFELLGKGR
ncbi:MAG: hypothetical protein PWP50_992, partial [Synergistaceae bacterium]|nr:hypothetical protein [Synergistaceae bacterium]